MFYHISFMVWIADQIDKSRIQVKSWTQNVRVLRGSEDFTIQCSARSSLSYCYLQSPTGKFYDYHLPTQQHPVGMKYSGMGLDCGECQWTTPREENVDTADTGKWVCGVGVEGLAEDLQISVDAIISGKMRF